MQDNLTYKALLGICLCVSTGGLLLAQQVAIPQTPSDVTPPVTDVNMSTEYAKAIGRMAYVWGWPMVNMMNRRAAITKAPQPGLLRGLKVVTEITWRKLR